MECLICGMDESVVEFSQDSPICKLCVEDLYSLYGVQYSPPDRHSIVIGCLRLIEAVRSRAVADGALEEFEDYWLRTPPWEGLLRTVYDELRRTDRLPSVSASVRVRVV